MSLWSWRRNDDPEDRRIAAAVPAGRGTPSHASGRAVATSPAGVRLGVSVLPEPGRPARSATDTAREAAVQAGTGSNQAPLADDCASSASAADQDVRRAIALAELSMLVADQA